MTYLLLVPCLDVFFFLKICNFENSHQKNTASYNHETQQKRIRFPRHRAQIQSPYFSVAFFFLRQVNFPGFIGFDAARKVAIFDIRLPGFKTAPSAFTRGGGLWRAILNYFWITISAELTTPKSICNPWYMTTFFDLPDSAIPRWDYIALIFYCDCVDQFLVVEIVKFCFLSSLQVVATKYVF